MLGEGEGVGGLGEAAAPPAKPTTVHPPTTVAVHRPTTVAVHRPTTVAVAVAVAVQAPTVAVGHGLAPERKG